MQIIRFAANSNLEIEAFKVARSYDLRKMKVHGLLDRDGRRYCYRLSEKGAKVALMMTLFHKRVCGPLANSLFQHRPEEQAKPISKIETAHHKTDKAIQQIVDLLAAA